MLKVRSKLRCLVLTAAAAAALANVVSGQGVKRLVIIKTDGLPNYFVDRFVRERDPSTGRSKLPWIDEVFYKNGSRMVNFYTRGMSLSAPSWAQLDTGQHLQIKGNVEFDRFTLHPYDYLNFVPYYKDYGLGKKVDMPAVEVLDQLGIPILSDMFPSDKKYTTPQLCQRGNNWGALAGGFINMLPRTKEDAIDEWTLGFEFRNLVADQNIRDIVGKVIKRNEIDYLDFYFVGFDHASHHFNDPTIRYEAIARADRVIGQIWTAIQKSSRAHETALVLVSDHGFNSEEGTYSQGFNLVKLLAQPEGGGHHVVTKRRLMMDYSVKGFYPLVPLITTTSSDSYYLKGQSAKYPTALVDFDGNERSSVHLRENDLNVLHILLQQLKDGNLQPAVRAAVARGVLEIIDKRRAGLRQTIDEMRSELDALHRWIEAKQAILPTLMMRAPRGKGLAREAEDNRRLAAQVEIAVKEENDYRAYVQTLENLLSLKPNALDYKGIDITTLVAAGAMGEPNSIYDLQNYVVGLSSGGLAVDAKGGLDLGKSFTRVNYFELLRDQTVRNNVQKKVGNRPVDFIAVRIPLDEIKVGLPGGEPNEDVIWLYGSKERQALLLTRADENGDHSYMYLPISGLWQDARGEVRFRIEEWSGGFPLKFLEDPALGVATAERRAWLGKWHNEIDWLNASHKTTYSNAVVGLNEQMVRHPLPAEESELSADEQLIHRLRERQRQLTDADMLIMANDHWNFDVRGFNPGGNHGSFFRVATNSTFMIAGGEETGIPRGLAVETPYDGMSFMPTILRLMGKIDGDNRPVPELYNRGFRRFPGRVVREIITTK